MNQLKQFRCRLFRPDSFVHYFADLRSVSVERNPARRRHYRLLIGLVLAKTVHVLFLYLFRLSRYWQVIHADVANVQQIDNQFNLQIVIFSLLTTFNLWLLYFRNWIPATRLIYSIAIEQDSTFFDESFSTLSIEERDRNQNLCRSLLKAGLVDRFRVVVFPVITGATGAERIYDGYPDVALDMVSTRTFDGRIQLLEYVPTVLAGPPGAHNGS